MFDVELSTLPYLYKLQLTLILDMPVEIKERSVTLKHPKVRIRRSDAISTQSSCSKSLHRGPALRYSCMALQSYLGWFLAFQDR